MLDIQEDLLEKPKPKTRDASSGGRTGYRYSLTSEKGKCYIGLEMPLAKLTEDFEFKFAVEPDGTEASQAQTIKLSFISSNTSEAAGLEKGRYAVVRKGGEKDLTLKKRGNRTRSIRLGTFTVDEEAQTAFRASIADDLEPIVATVGGEKALVFRMPDFALQAEA